MRLESFNVFTVKIAKYGARSPIANSRKTAIGGISPTIRGGFSLIAAGVAGSAGLILLEPPPEVNSGMQLFLAHHFEGIATGIVVATTRWRSCTPLPAKPPVH